jgi:hypothetical protein
LLAFVEDLLLSFDEDLLLLAAPSPEADFESDFESDFASEDSDFVSVFDSAAPLLPLADEAARLSVL